MKILVMCEGPNEKAVVEMLLDAGRLKFSRDDLVVLNVYHARQLTSPIIKTNLNIYTGDFEVYRIGDTLTDFLFPPTIEAELKESESSVPSRSSKCSS